MRLMGLGSPAARIKETALEAAFSGGAAAVGAECELDYWPYYAFLLYCTSLSTY